MRTPLPRDELPLGPRDHGRFRGRAPAAVHRRGLPLPAVLLHAAAPHGGVHRLHGKVLLHIGPDGGRDKRELASSQELSETMATVFGRELDDLTAGGPGRAVGPGGARARGVARLPAGLTRDRRGTCVGAAGQTGRHVPLSPPGLPLLRPRLRRHRRTDRPPRSALGARPRRPGVLPGIAGPRGAGRLRADAGRLRAVRTPRAAPAVLRIRSHAGIAAAPCVRRQVSGVRGISPSTGGC